MMKHWIARVVLALGMLSPVAHAQSAESGPERSVEAPRRRVWYGWQTLTADAVSVTLPIVGAATGADPLVPIGVAGYFLASPIVHFSHGNVGRGFGSLGLRVGSPLVAAAVGVRVERAEHGGCDIYCGFAGAAVGAFVGMAAAIALDASLLAYDSPPPVTVSVVPAVINHRVEPRLMVSGSF